MENTTIDYLEKYQEFEKNFRLTEISGEETGALIMHMCSYFSKYNIQMGIALRALSVVKADFQTQTDIATGKAMSSSKADTLAAATEEADRYQMARIHVQNIEQILNSLKALQRGQMFEYSNST